MKKFEGILICTDLDDTLLTTDKRVSDENIAAVKYFTDNGGLFTFATGRVPRGFSLILKYITPNAPIVSYNGGAIYDVDEQKFLWYAELDRSAVEVMEYVDKFHPYAGIECTTAKAVYFNKVNHLVEEHKVLEHFQANYSDYHDIAEPIMKTIFMVENHEIDEFKRAIQATEFPKRYSFVQSSPWYYELLPYGCSKGAGLKKVAAMTGALKTVGIGDNENDISLVCDADVGVAVQNAAAEVKEKADYITRNDHNHHAVAEVIE
ncbi:MAG: HAD family hydrolase, partial [Firmicutes bacterium]|nr:HAD family hydrolase [Bacillota bacterium]